MVKCDHTGCRCTRCGGFPVVTPEQDNPTGTDNAQVQDAEAKARELCSGVEFLSVCLASTTKTAGNLTEAKGLMQSAIAQALREAERRGMMRAAEISKSLVEPARGDRWAGRRDAFKEAARAIERAAGEG
jgi:hypothetical protein